MKFKRFTSTLLMAAASSAMIAPAEAHAQMAVDIDRLWCIQKRESLVRSYQAVDRMRAERAAGISRLRAEHQVQANRNLQAWYWKKVEELFKQRRALETECRAVEMRADAPSQGRVAPPPRRQAPRSNQQETWRYPPYERHPEPNDPFSSK